MKKKLFIGVLLLVSINLFALDSTEPKYKIGDRGPAGGIIFSISGNNIWEVSEYLGHMRWDKAFRACPEYHGGGYNDWYLPTKDELEDIYYNLVKPGILETTDTYWSSNMEESMTLWAYNYKKGRPGLYGITREFAVRAVRHFEMHE